LSCNNDDRDRDRTGRELKGWEKSGKDDKDERKFNSPSPV